MFRHYKEFIRKPIALTWRKWWGTQTPSRQDRFAFLAPLMAVLVFMVAITSVFWYLKYEEIDREQEIVRRDVEYAQQRVRLRLLDKQEELMRFSKDLSVQQLGTKGFITTAQKIIDETPELSSLTWLDIKRRVIISVSSANSNARFELYPGVVVNDPGVVSIFQLTKELKQPIYSKPITYSKARPAPFSQLQLHLPIFEKNLFEGVIVAEYSLEGILRFAIPAEISGQYIVSLRDDKNNVLAGQANKAKPRVTEVLPWLLKTNEYEVPVMPVGYSLSIHAQTYRTAPGMIGNGMYWLVAILSAMTAWLLIGSWRHTRRRVQAQQALMAETNFRRAMENSILTGMRAMDLKGCITYVNAAFCQMTGWAESELVGRFPPFPYWPEEDIALLNSRLQKELDGNTSTNGLQVRVKRKDGNLFDARLYVSPLVDAVGKQTGWMTSMTDITEPTRIRQQLSAAHDRFTAVLEGLDASVSVAPLGSEELLFANKLYRKWFDPTTQGHLSLVMQAGLPRTTQSTSTELATVGADEDDSDPLAGFPLDDLQEIQSENAEIFLPDLGKWLEVRSRYLNWVDGRLAQIVIATDITPRRQAEEQAQAQAERAQTASRLITMGEMASSVAHELNQPLTAINNYCNGMVSRIKAKKLNEAELITALEKTAHQAQRAGQIIQRIRSFVKRSEPNRTLSSVPQLVSEAVELAGIELRRRQVRLSQVIASRLPQIHVDPILIEQVLVNLMRNAAESIDTAQRPFARRQVELKVVPRTEHGVSVIEFSVTDTGSGLAPEVMERLFEAFFSTKAEGMGIGLNLCRSIVESHEGRMQAENLYNASQLSGCRFSFWIPAR